MKWRMLHHCKWFQHGLITTKSFYELQLADTSQFACSSRQTSHLWSLKSHLVFRAFSNQFLWFQYSRDLMLDNNFEQKILLFMLLLVFFWITGLVHENINHLWRLSDNKNGALNWKRYPATDKLENENLHNKHVCTFPGFLYVSTIFNLLFTVHYSIFVRVC